MSIQREELLNFNFDQALTPNVNVMRALIENRVTIVAEFKGR